MSADDPNFDPHRVGAPFGPRGERFDRREPGFGADRGAPPRGADRVAGFGANDDADWGAEARGEALDDQFDDAPTLEEAFGLHSGRRSARARRGAAFERASSALGGVFLGRSFARRPGANPSDRSYWPFNWGWGGAWPLMIGVALGAAAAAAPSVQRAVGDGFERMSAAMLSRPEFAIRRLEVTGMRRLSEDTLKEAVQNGVAERAALAFDYKGARRRIEALGWVERASVVLQPPNTLAIDIVERRPAALWRRGESLTLIDPSGVTIAEARARSDHSDLPLLVGAGAAKEIGEALRLSRVAQSGGLQIGALTRVGERRWDIELLGGPRLMLPELEPQLALERAVQLAREAALFDLGFEVVDLRLPFAPTARPRPSTELAAAGR